MLDFKNLALKKTAQQSSISAGGPEVVVDGLFNVTTAAKFRSLNWWSVNLSKSVIVRYMTLYLNQWALDSTYYNGLVIETQSADSSAWEPCQFPRVNNVIVNVTCARQPEALVVKLSTANNELLLTEVEVYGFFKEGKTIIYKKKFAQQKFSLIHLNLRGQACQ